MSRLRGLPGVDTLLEAEPLRRARERWPAPLLAASVREALEEARSHIRAGAACPRPEELIQRALDHLAAQERRFLVRTINATGVILHTNLGRAPLGGSALEAVRTAAGGYANLEYDLEAGRRGRRDTHGEELLCRVSGAEAALVVNNNAAAVLLALSALARGGEVVISRGELIEIGGAFRIPEILEQSGCILREVGTTNRTHLRDYEGALGEQTSAILKVHPSNYRVVGFTGGVSAAELVELGHARGLPVIEDLGSGVLVDTARYGLEHEPTVQEAVQAGLDLVTCSGDKLLGGPQAGIILGRREAVERCRRHPLARAVRVDKMALAALQATLLAYLDDTWQELPIYRMLAATTDELDARARRLAAALEGSGGVEVVDGASAVGGGSLPGETLPTRLVSVRPRDGAAALAARLRRGKPPVVARIEDAHVRFDLRTVAPEDDDELAVLVRRALEAGA